MKRVSPEEYPEETIERLVQGITFFNEILREDKEQFKVLMEQSDIVEVEPGEVVISKGDSDPFLYFLLKGQLQVFPENYSTADQFINSITPGQLFGTLAMIRGTPRSACIKADKNSRTTLLFKVNFQFFSNIEDFTFFTMPTKLAFYRVVVHNIRWTLEEKKMQNPSHPLLDEMKKVKLYLGPKGGEEELKALHEQAFGLADILDKWNVADQTAAYHSR